MSTSKGYNKATDKKIQISARQFCLLAVTYIIATADVFLPAFVAQEAKQDAWISVIIGTIYALIVANIYISLGLKHPEKSIIQYSCDIFGKFLGKITGAAYVYFYLIIAWTVTRELEEIFVIAFNPDAPILIYGILVVIVAAYAVFSGLEVIARVNDILLPIGIGVLLLIAVINIPNVDLSRFLPVFYNGFQPSLKGAILIQTWMVEPVVFLQLLPLTGEKQKIRKYMNFSFLAVGMGLQVGTLTIAVFGSTLTGKLLFPALEYVRLARLGPYIQNLEISIMVVWISGIFIKIALSFYASAEGMSHLLGFKSYKSLILPIGSVIVVFASASSRMLSDIIHFMKYIIPFYFAVMSLFIPLLLLTVSGIKDRIQGGASAAKQDLERSQQ